MRTINNTEWGGRVIVTQEEVCTTALQHFHLSDVFLGGRVPQYCSLLHHRAYNNSVFFGGQALMFLCRKLAFLVVTCTW